MECASSSSNASLSSSASYRRVTNRDRIGVLCGPGACGARAWTGKGPLTSLAYSRGGLFMRRFVQVSSLSLVLALSLATPVQSAPVPAALTPAVKPLIDVKSDPKTGKIIATLPKATSDGVSARYIYITQL